MRESDNHGIWGLLIVAFLGALLASQCRKSREAETRQTIRDAFNPPPASQPYR